MRFEWDSHCARFPVPFAKLLEPGSNDQRTALAAGWPADCIKITVHKDSGEPRFGWKMVEPGSGDVRRIQRRQGAPATQGAEATESAAVAAPAAEQRECPGCGGNPALQ